MICNHKESGNPCGDAGGGWIHWLDGSTPSPVPHEPAPPPIDEPPRASLRTISRAYSTLLRILPLSPEHRANLHQRGMSDREIDARGYRSLNGSRGRLCREITDAGVDIVGVPGFYVQDGPTGHYWTVGGPRGMLIPVRDGQGEIVAVKIRADNPEAGGKYVWLSSSGRRGGVTSGAPPHVARPSVLAHGSPVWITEGPLKADIACERVRASVVAIPGVGAWACGVETVADITESPRLIVALDADAANNPQVLAARTQIIEKALERGWTVRVATWPPPYKGVDDALAAGARIWFIPVEKL